MRPSKRQRHCSSPSAPHRSFFESDTEQIRSFFNTYTEAFQRSNPDTSVVFISYPNSQFFNQIKSYDRLNLGPDLIITEPLSATELLTRNLISELPDQKYLDSIYNPRIQTEAKSTSGYMFAPWIINTQIACFDKTKIETSPKTTEDLEALSASGKKSDLPQIFWT